MATNKRHYSPMAKTKEAQIEEIKNTLNAKQLEAFNIFQNTDQNLFLTDSGGVGKSFLISALIRCASISGLTCLVTASTGKSAEDVNGITEHRAFGFGASMGIKMRGDGFVCQASTVSRADILIIEEISMVPVSHIDAIYEAVEAAYIGNKRLEGRKAKGKKKTRVIVLGDFAQMQPVISDDDRKLLENYYMDKFGIDLKGKACYAFQGLHWTDFHFCTINLTESVRLSKKRQKELMEGMRRNKLTWRDLKEFFDSTSPEPIDDSMWLFATNDEAFRHNMSELEKLNGTLYRFPAVWGGDYSKEEKENCKVEDFFCKKWAKVMILNNSTNYADFFEYHGLEHDLSKLFCNGTTGIITDIVDDADPNKQRVTVMFNQRGGGLEEVTFKRKRTSVKQPVGDNLYMREKFFYEAFPLRICYGVTTHKAQGASLDSVCIDMSKSWAPSQIYVAASRCRDLSKVYLSTMITPNMVFIDPDVEAFYREIDPEWDRYEVTPPDDDEDFGWVSFVDDDVPDEDIVLSYLSSRGNKEVTTTSEKVEEPKIQAHTTYEGAYVLLDE